MGKKKDWSPDDPLLKSTHAPYEINVVTRMYNAGWPGAAIMRTLNLTGSKVMTLLSKDNDAASHAQRQGRAIHDAVIKKGQ